MFNKGVLYKEVVGVDPPGLVQFTVGSHTFKWVDRVACRLCHMPDDPRVREWLSEAKKRPKAVARPGV